MVGKTANGKTPATVIPVNPGGISPLAGTVRLLLYGLLVVAVVGMLLQGRRQAQTQPLSTETSAEQVPPTMASAAPWRLRVAAAGVDLLPLVFTAGLVTSEPQLANGAVGTVIVLAGLVTYVLLPLAGEMTSGRSPGKAIFGLRVRRLDGGEPSPSAILIRNVVRPLDLFIGWAVAMVVPDRRRPGDLAAGTVVVYEPVGTRQTSG